MIRCPFCGLDPYEYIDVGVGHIAIAVNCCNFGPTLFDDRTPDRRWTKIAERVLNELGEIEYGDERLRRTAELFDKFIPNNGIN